MTRRWTAGLVALAVAAGLVGTAAAQKAPGVIETADAEWSGVQTELLEVKRMSDNTIRVRWRWRNTGDKDVTVPEYLVLGILREETYLLDPVNKKKHHVVTDAKGSPIATDIPRQTFRLKAKESFSGWAKFPAPPPNVEKITVVIAKTPPFEDIPVTK
jgi:hypothetical protein